MIKKKKLVESEIDESVVKQVDDDSAWEKTVHMRRAKGASFSISPELAARAAFLAKLRHKSNVAEWLERVIQERIELEEAAFVGVKQEVTARAG
jgi:hypothetical protein